MRSSHASRAAVAAALVLIVAPTVLPGPPAEAASNVEPYVIRQEPTRFGSDVAGPGPEAASVYALPFGFRFFGATYTTVHVSPRGFVGFETDAASQPATFVGLAAVKGIAPNWGPDPASRVEVVHGPADSWIAFRWIHESTAPATRFDVLLYADGRIRFDYGEDRLGGTSRVVGISNGPSKQYVLEQGFYNASRRNTILFEPVRGASGPVASLLAPTPGTVYVAGQPQGSLGDDVPFAVSAGALTLRAKATSPLGTPTLAIYVGATLLAQRETTELSVSWTPPSPELETYAVRAVATDRLGSTDAVVVDLLATGALRTVEELLQPRIEVGFPNGGEVIDARRDDAYETRAVVTTLCDEYLLWLYVSEDDGRTWRLERAPELRGGPVPRRSQEIETAFARYETGMARVRAHVKAVGCPGVGDGASDASDGRFAIDSNDRAASIEEADPDAATAGWHTQPARLRVDGFTASGFGYFRAQMEGDGTLWYGGSYLDEFERPVIPGAPEHSWEWLSGSTLPVRAWSIPVQGRAAGMFEVEGAPGAVQVFATARRVLPPEAQHVIGQGQPVSMWVKLQGFQGASGTVRVRGWGDGGSVFELSGQVLPQWTRLEGTVARTGTVRTLYADFTVTLDETGGENLVRNLFVLDALRVEPLSPAVHDEGRTLWRGIVEDPLSDGAWEESPAIPVQVDRQAPSGAVDIAAGAGYVPSTSVTLGLDGFDAASGVRDVMLSNRADFAGAGWEPYATTRAWTLEPLAENETSATRHVHVRFRDGVGRESASASDLVVVDVAAPVDAGGYEPGEGWIAVRDVRVALRVADNVALYPSSANVSVSTGAPSWRPAAFTDDGDGRGGTVSGSFRLHLEGRYKAGFRIRDGAGNEMTAFRDLHVDLWPPSCGVDVRAAYASSPSVDVRLTSGDAMSGTATMRIYLDGAQEAPSEPYATSKRVDLPPGDGRREVAARFADRVGHESSRCADTVVLDTRRPLVDPVSPPDGARGAGLTPTIAASWEDDESQTPDVSGVDVPRGWMTIRPSAQPGRTNVTALATRTDDGISYRPTAPLLPATEYEACVGVADRAGNVVDQVCWRFTT